MYIFVLISNFMKLSRPHIIRKSARITHLSKFARGKACAIKTDTSRITVSCAKLQAKEESAEITFRFEIITPMKQLEERNSAYNFFTL